MTVAMYIVFICKHFHSASKVEEAVSSISWAHNLAGFPDPCHSSLVLQVKEGVLRECSRPVTKKEPILPEHLLLLVEKYGNKKCRLPDVRIATFCLSFWVIQDSLDLMNLLTLSVPTSRLQTNIFLFSFPEVKPTNTMRGRRFTSPKQV